MWLEIVDNEGKTVGAVNTDDCGLMKIDGKAESGALIRNSTGEVFKTKRSYLRLIEAITQSEAEGLKQIADIVADVKDQKDAPRLVML